MPLLNWDNSYSVGVPEMDDQHKQLISIANKLYEAMKAGKSKETLSQVFDELIEYTKFHFTAEEALMRKVNYPGLNDQSTQHSDLTKKVLEFQAKFKEGALFISIDVLNFLKDWLVNHIVKMDKLYGSFINKTGV